MKKKQKISQYIKIKSRKLRTEIEILGHKEGDRVNRHFEQDKCSLDLREETNVPPRWVYPKKNLSNEAQHYANEEKDKKTLESELKKENAAENLLKHWACYSVSIQRCCTVQVQPECCWPLAYVWRLHVTLIAMS